MRIIFGSLILLSGITPAWGVISSCSTPTALNPTFTTGSTPPPSTTPTANGCDATNLRFTNFSVGTDQNSTITVGATTVTIGPNVFTSPNNNSIPPDGTNIMIGVGGIAGDAIDFSPVPANRSGVGCQPNSNNQGWCINGANESMASDITYTVTGLNSHTITSIGLAAELSEHTNGSGAGASATVFREICAGAPSITWGATSAASQAACAAANGTYFVLAIGTTLFGGHSNTYTPGSDSVSFSAVSVLAIRDTVYLTTVNGSGGWAAVGDFGVFEVTPEPASLLTIASGFVVLGLLTWLRKRKAQA